MVKFFSLSALVMLHLSVAFSKGNLKVEYKFDFKFEC